MGEIRSGAYLSPHASGLWGCILFKFGQQLGRHVLHFVLIAKGHIHPPVCQGAHQCGPSSSVTTGHILLTNTNTQEPALVKKSPTDALPSKECSQCLAWQLLFLL